eukprot:g15726.t1
MSSEASARNPELLSEEVPAKFVNEGLLRWERERKAWLAGGSRGPVGRRRTRARTMDVDEVVDDLFSGRGGTGSLPQAIPLPQMICLLSSAARNALRDTIVACNSLAMSALGRGNTERCRDLLTRAFEIASARQMRGRSIGDKRHKHDDATDSGGGGDFVLQVLTLNNTACLHRRLGESKRALRCLRRAAELGRRSGGNEHLEVTHLNACAVLSELGRHEEALEHARSAVYYGQELEEVGTRAGVPERGGEAHLTSSSGAGSRSRRARLATLAISYYNLAVELEYTHRYEACLRWYNEAVKLARDPDVHNEELIKTFQRSYAEARKLYVDVDSDEEKSQKPGGTYLGSASNHNNVDPRFDNGRDGKLYVEPDNGRDGKLYGEPVDDEEQWTEESNGTRSLEAAPEINDAAANDTVRDREGLETYGIGTAEELRQENTAEASPPERFAGAAIVIQRAIAGAATRQRSSRHGGGAKGAGKALPEKYLLDPAGNSRRALSERESDGTKQKGERVSAADVATATLEVSASESVVQKRRKLAREAANRHVLAASTIRAWIARTCLARQLHRKKRARDDLKLRWEPEIQRIAATRIQAVARGVIGWRAWRRVQRAAVEIQRVERGWRGRAAANELSRTRLEEGRSSCETIQRVFRGHRGRQKAMRIRQIAWEETVARQGAAGVLQSAWHRRPNRRILQEPQQHTQRESTTTTTVGQAEKDDSASLAASSMTPTAGPERNLSTESSDAMPRQQLQRGAEAHGAVFAVWGAFNSLLATAATRCTVHRAVEQALLAPAAETLSIFNRNRGNGATTADLGSSTSLPSSPSRARIAALPPPDPVSFDCAPRFKRDMAVAVRRMAGTVLARASSLSGARAAVGILIGGASCGGEGGDFGSCSGVEDDESREGGRAAAEAVGDEAVALVLKVAEECWAFLSSSDSSPLAGLDDRVVSELLTEMLSDKLQGLIGNLGRICSPPSNLESIVLPVALVRALASSATASLLSHPDVAECVGLGRSEDGEEYDDGGVSLHPRGRNNLELGPIVSEVYCSFLSVLESGGCGTKNDQTREMNDAEEEPDAIGAPGRERKLSPFSPSPPSSSLVQIRTDERLQFLQSFAELIHGTAEELMSGMGTSGWHYDDAVSRMTSGLWEIARCGLIPCDADESREGGEENFSMSLPLTKQELQGGITGLGVDTVNPEDTPPASSGFLEITGNGGAADVLSPCPPPTGEGKKNPIDAPENGSSCSSRFTDARSVKEDAPPPSLKERQV